MNNSALNKQVGRPREFDEEAVLAAVMEAFWHKGYEATSVADLTERTGLNKASLYRFFGDKHSLFKTALECYTQASFRDVKQVVVHKSPLANIHAIIDKLTEDAEEGKGCLMVNLSIIA